MKPFLGAVLVAALALAPARADDASAVLDKAIKALGGEEKLAKAHAMTWKSKGKLTFGDDSGALTSEATTRGLNHYRSEWEAEFNGNPVKGVTVVSGDKGWRKIGDNVQTLEGEMLTLEKRNIYLQIIPAVLLPLKGKDFKIEPAGEHEVGGKPATALKATGPDGKDLTLYFDKQSGLPVKQEARAIGWGGEEYNQETRFSDYKDFDGIKRATRVEVSRDGEKFLEADVTEFRVRAALDDATFSEPQ